MALSSLPLFLAKGYYLPSESMSPTLRTGDKVSATRDDYRTHEPKRGDIVVFRVPALALSLLGQQEDRNNPTFYLKRVIGLPGDRIRIVANQGVFINGKLLHEPYVREQVNYDFPPVRYDDARRELQPYLEGNSLLVPKDQYFVLGDNRMQSHDSHIWGLLPRDDLRGRVFFRWWPLDHFGAVH